MEFSQYRGYEPGDDPRLLDWKMLARSGRYYVRQSEVETHTSIKFVLDASRSMAYSDNGLTKMDYARVLVATIAYLAQRQGDAIGLFALNDHKLYSLYPKVQKQHYNRLLLELVNIQNEGKWPSDPAMADQLHDRRHKELIIFITDMYEYHDELSKVISGMKASKNEVVVLQLLSKKELEFDYEGAVTFEDMETGKRMKVNAGAARANYLLALENRIDTIRKEMLTRDISHEVFRIDEPMGEALGIFLKKRQKLV